MSVRQKYQLALQLRNLININLKQSCFLQIRCGVGQERFEKENIFAQGYEIIQQPELQENQKKEEGEILSDGSYLSPKFFVKHNVKNIQINSTCIFKGEIETSNSENETEEIFISCQLNWMQAEENEVISEWHGYLKFHIVSSALEIYFPSHLFTCLIQASVHCLITDTLIEKEEELQPLKSKLFYNPIERKMSQLYEVIIDPMITSYRELEDWVNEFKSFHMEEKQSKNSSGKEYLKFKKLQKFLNLPKQTKNLTIEEKEKLPNEMKKIKFPEYFSFLKEDSHELALLIYPLWKQLIALFHQYVKSPYFENLKEEYHKCWNKQRQLNKIQILKEQKILNQSLNENKFLKIQSFQKNECKLLISDSDYESFNSILHDEEKKTKILIFVHGFQASSFDMEVIAMYFKLRNPNLLCYISQNNEGRTEGAIEDLGHRLAVEVKNLINSKGIKDMEISFFGHSLGGLIIRASLKYLQLYKTKFKSFITLCSPHMGYLHHTSKLISTSLWVMTKLKKDQSMLELTMQDHPQLNKTYIYELSNRKEISWFQNIILLGSKEDEYVPFTSALLQNREFFLKTESSKVYQEIYDNLRQKIEKKTLRIEIVYNDKVKDLSSLIGRTAHIKALSYLPVIDLFTFLISKKL